MDKATREYQALRSAAEAVKMMALSQQVECPVNIKDYFTTPQCPTVSGDILKSLPSATAETQFRRGLIFFRSLQQGVKPTICDLHLPEEEEAQFIKDWQTVMSTYVSKLGDTRFQWFCRTFLHIPKNEIVEVNDAFRRYLTGGVLNVLPLRSLLCKETGTPNNDDIERFSSNFVMLNKQERQYRFDDFDNRQSKMYIHGKSGTGNYNVGMTGFSYAAVETTPSDIYKVNILIYDYSNIPEPQLTANSEPSDVDKLLYISANKKIINFGDNPTIITGEYITNYRVMKDLFTVPGAVVDVHPWLMYLLQTTPATHDLFMSRAFGGSMSPLKNHNLAFYIIAHYVANHDPVYKGNPSTFYRLDYSKKFIKMKTAVGAAKSLIDKGYAWLKEKRPTDSELKTMFNNRPEFSGRNFRGLIKGGKRVTRRLRK